MSAGDHGSLGRRLEAVRRRNRPIVVVTVGTLLLVVASFVLCLGLLYLVMGSQAIEQRLHLSLSLIIPLVVAPPALGYYLRVVEQLDQLTTAYQTLAEDYRRSAQVDFLTGVLNRRGLFDQSAVVPAGHVLALADINGFKAINDTHGHLVGDEVLVAVAHALTQVVRGRGVVARTGGDEFVIVCPAGEEEPGPSLAIPMRDGLHVAVSIGAVTTTRPTELDQAMAAADARMYAAKHGGTQPPYRRSRSA